MDLESLRSGCIISSVWYIWGQSLLDLVLDCLFVYMRPINYRYNQKRCRRLIRVRAVGKMSGLSRRITFIRNLDTGPTDRSHYGGRVNISFSIINKNIFSMLGLEFRECITNISICRVYT
jgi:hypothetical protein